MENRLKELFDYQLFEGNAALQAVIDSVHRHYAVRELDLSELATVSAAGMARVPKKKQD